MPCSFAALRTKMARTGLPAGHASAFLSTRSGAFEPSSGSASSGCGSTVDSDGGMTSACTAIVALIRPATPAAALAWPIMPLMELTAACSAEPVERRSSDSAVSSTLSPSGVPVPWPSNSGTVSEPKPARWYARAIAIR